MPTNANAYNTRVTDESLEKRFRDTFRSQGGAELVDDLYAQGVIVPVVDFTAAATGQQLAENLQTAWDFSTGSSQITSTTATTIISNAGFWQIDLNFAGPTSTSAAVRNNAVVDLYDGATSKPVWAYANQINYIDDTTGVVENKFVVFLRSGDVLRARVGNVSHTLDLWYRQIATVNGDLVNPSGFTSS